MVNKESEMFSMTVLTTIMLSRGIISRKWQVCI